MRIFYTLVILLSSAHFLTAQEGETSPQVQEIGLNATSLFNEFLDFNGDPTSLVPYHFTYKSLKANGKGFRLGAGFRLRRSKNDPNSTFFADDETHTLVSMNLRLGWERQRQISKRWSLVYGWDWVTGYSHSEVKAVFNSFDDTKLTTSSFHVGFGPVVGMQFMFNEKVGLATEANMYLLQTFGKSKEEFDGSDEDDNNFNSTSLDFILPTNLFIFMRF